MTSSETHRDTGCPIGYALEIFGDRWTLIVLRDLLLVGHRRYGQLLATSEGIATNILSDRLKRLEQRGLVAKSRDPGDARQFIYTPTETAIALVPMLLEMMAWSGETAGITSDQALMRAFRGDRERCISDLQKRIRARIQDS